MVDRANKRPKAKRSLFSRIYRYSILSLSLLMALPFLVLYAVQFLRGAPSKQEQAVASEKEILDTFQAMRGRTCKRPVLRGKPVQGDAAPHALAAVVNSPENALCWDLIQSQSVYLSDLMSHPWTGCCFDYPERYYHPYVSSNLTPGDRKFLVAIKNTCKPYVEALRRATQYEDGCSFYIKGASSVFNRVVWDSPPHPEAFVLGELSEGNTQRALETAFDLIRFHHDISRGNAPWRASSMGLRQTSSVVSIVEKVFNRPESIDINTLAQARRELTVLIDTMPHPSTHFEGGIEEWTASLNTSDRSSDSEIPAWLTTTPYRDHTSQDIMFDSSIPAIKARKQAYDYLKEIKELKAEIREACPADALPFDCIEDLKSRYDDLEWRESRGLEDFRRGFKSLLFTGQDEVLRERIANEIRVQMFNHIWYMVALSEQQRFSLAALRLMVDYRILAETSQTCPAVSVLKDSVDRDHLVDPHSGMEMRIETADDGGFVIRPAIPITDDWEQDADSVSIAVKCPFESKCKWIY